MSTIHRPKGGVGRVFGHRGLQLALEAFTAALELILGLAYRQLAALGRLIASTERPTAALPGGAFSTDC